MANTIAIKRRISSVANTRQITKAMELVAASRMRKAQEAAQRSRAYNKLAREILTRISGITEVAEYPLFKKRTVKARLLIVITSDRGLAGAYNSNVLRAYLAALKTDKTAGVKNYTIAIGQKAAQFVARLSNAEVIGVYRHLPEELQVHDLQPIIREATKLFTEQKVDKVDVVYTHFHSSINQSPEIFPLLPAGFAQTEEKFVSEPEFEPSAEGVLGAAAKKLIDSQLWQAMLESAASEQSMRMLAMKNATDNATELVDDLTLAFNNIRQASITQELAEITGGAEAMSD